VTVRDFSITEADVCTAEYSGGMLQPRSADICKGCCGRRHHRESLNGRKVADEPVPAHFLTEA